jgi:poly(A) polymerase
LAQWWEDFSLADDDQRRDMVEQARQQTLQKPSGSRVRRVAKSQNLDDHPSNHMDDADGGQPQQDDALPDAPARKRRRRRKPNNGAGGADAAVSMD